MTEEENKDWARREAWRFLLRFAGSFFVAFMLKLAGFGERIPNYVVTMGAVFCVIPLFDLLYRVWRHCRHEAHRPSGSKGDQINGENDV